MIINTNASSLNAIQNLEKNKAALNSSMEKLSSGLKINKGADDAANLAIATRMAAQIGSLLQASTNAQAGISLINIADSSLDSIAESITSLRSLAIQAANGTLTSLDRSAINANAVSILEQIDSVSSQTNFNGLNLLDGTFNTVLQVGTEAGDTIRIQIGSSNTADIGTVIEKSESVQSALKVGSLALNGENIKPSIPDGLSYLFPDSSAIAISNAINASGTSVQAVANPNVTETQDFVASSNTSGFITINGVRTSEISLSRELSSNVDSAIVAVNDIKTQTGVEASKSPDNKLVLTAADGRNITVAYSSGIQNTDLGAVPAGTTIGSVTLTASTSITVGGSHPEFAGLTGGTTSNLTTLSTVDLSTQENAVTSLTVIDGAINTISAMRANLGAIENRLYSTIENLSNNAVDLLDAKSQIMDTDFAVEMANFAKLQIMQQASTSILAYANAQPQSILKLLN